MAKMKAKAKGNVNLYYDGKGDILDVIVGKPTKSYYEPLGNDVLKRIDEKTGNTVGFMVLNFKKRTKNFNAANIKLPLNMKLS